MPVTYIHVLVIHDDTAQSEQLTRPFPSWGWDATRVSSEPAGALAALAARRYDLVLLDLHAAERDEYAFLRDWRQHPPFSAIPVVITSRPGPSLARLARCIEHGATDYITHPDHHVLLRARLQNVLQRKLLQEQANTALEAFNEIEKIADDLRLVILPIGAALSAEVDFNRLTARVVQEAQDICNADTGALCLAREDGMMHYVYMHIRSTGYTHQEEAGETGFFGPAPLSDPVTGEPNYDSLAVYVALRGESVNLGDLHAGRFENERLTRFEQQHTYRAQSCLAVPLRSGHVVGALILVNCRHPLSGEVVPFDAYHQQVAESLASQASVVLNNRLLSDRENQLMRYKRELEIGREIQLSFLPAQLPDPPGWELKAYFRPALEVAGDFYDAFLLPHGHVALIISDVVGKGVTAALFMAIIRSLFRALFQQNYFQIDAAGAGPGSGATLTPFSFVDRAALLNAIRLTNAYLLANHADTYAFATMFAAVLDPATGRLLYVNAGHNPPLVLGRARQDGRVVREQLPPTGPAIGLLVQPAYWLAETRLAVDDLLFAYTDGVTEARDPAAEELGLARVTALLRAGHTATEALAAVEKAVREHTAGAEAFDDVTMFALRRVPEDETDDGGGEGQATG